MHRRLTRILPAFVLLSACPLFSTAAALAQGAASADDDLQKSAQALVDAAFKADAPGATVILVKDGKAVYRGARGLANVEQREPLGPESALRIGSVTKQFSSAALMMLVEQGKVGLSDEITKFFPDYPTHGKRITVEHLLTHTSGIKSYTSMPEWRAAWGKDFTTAELIDFFKNQPMDFDPGERYLYNNSAYFIVGAIIEKVSGMPYGEFVKRTIFTPLGMTRSRYGDWPAGKGSVVGYAPGGEGFVKAPYLSMTQPGAAGALVSSVDDLAKWDAAVSAGKLLQPESWNRIFTTYKLNNGRPTGYGFGWQVGTFDGRQVHEHGGGIHGFSAYVVRLPEHRVYAAVLTNTSDGNASGLARKLAALAAGKPLVDPKPMTIAAATLAEYGGVYEFGDGKLTITPVDGGLRLQPAGGSPARLLPMAQDQFFIRDSFSRFAFERDAAGKVVGVTRTRFNGVDKGRLTGEPLPKARQEMQLDPKIFDAYVGEYQLAPSFVLTVSREGERFMTQATGQGKVEIFAESETEFFLKVVEAQLTFVKDAAGKVTGLVLHQNGRDVKGQKIK